MNRRTILLGFGTAATGTSLVLGSGALTQVSAARSVTIRVDEDSDALVELDAGDPDIVTQNSDGQLEISTDGFGDLNEDATVEVGDIDSPSNTPAFSVTNNFDESISVQLNLENIDSSGNFTLHFDSDWSGTLASNGETTETLDPDETGDVAIEIVDTGTAGSTFNGTLAIEVTPDGGN